MFTLQEIHTNPVQNKYLTQNVVYPDVLKKSVHDADYNSARSM